MSGICGVVNFKGQPINKDTLKKMVEFIDYRGPDGINYFVEDNVGLVNLAFNTTPESLLEKQPLISADLILTADARVDNREPLIKVLKDKGYLKGIKHTDADLILAAYECWEEDCPKHIIGDFSFAVWDKSKEKLFMARDSAGLRQLFYSFYDNTLFFASAMQPIAHALPKMPSLNIQLMQDFLRRSFNLWTCQTIFKGVSRLPPAHFISVENGSLKKRLYYVFGQQPKPDFSHDEEWIDAFQDLLDEILTNQLRSITPVGIWVSGGLDSSALACQTYHLRKKDSDLPKIKLISSIFEDMPSANEKPFFDSVAEYCEGTSVKYVISDDKWAFCELGRDDEFPMDEPDIWELRGYTRGTMKATRDEGCSVYLTGLGSDDLIGQAFYHTPVALRDVKLKDWIQEISWFKKKGGLKLFDLLLRAYLFPIVPNDLAFKVLTFFRKNKLHLLNKNNKPSNVNICNLKENFMKPPGLDNYGLKAYQMLRNPWFTSSFDMFGLMAFHNGLEIRQPYLDRRMIEFLIKIPSHLRSFNGVTRVLLRESMRDKMPENVRMRSDKGLVTELYYNGFNKEKKRIRNLLQNSELEKLGLVDSTKLEHEFKLLWEKNYENSKYLAWYITLETWLREK